MEVDNEFLSRWRADINGEELEQYIYQPVLSRTLVPVDLAWWKHPFSARAIFTLFRLWVIYSSSIPADVF